MRHDGRRGLDAPPRLGTWTDRPRSASGAAEGVAPLLRPRRRGVASGPAAPRRGAPGPRAAPRTGRGRRAPRRRHRRLHQVVARDEGRVRRPHGGAARLRLPGLLREPRRQRAAQASKAAASVNSARTAARPPARRRRVAQAAEGQGEVRLVLRHEPQQVSTSAASPSRSGRGRACAAVRRVGRLEARAESRQRLLRHRHRRSSSSSNSGSSASASRARFQCAMRGWLP